MHQENTLGATCNEPYTDETKTDPTTQEASIREQDIYFEAILRIPSVQLRPFRKRPRQPAFETYIVLSLLMSGWMVTAGDKGKSKGWLSAEEWTDQWERTHQQMQQGEVWRDANGGWVQWQIWPNGDKGCLILQAYDKSKDAYFRFHYHLGQLQKPYTTRPHGFEMFYSGIIADSQSPKSLRQLKERLVRPMLSMAKGLLPAVVSPNATLLCRFKGPRGTTIMPHEGGPVGDQSDMAIEENYVPTFLSVLQDSFDDWNKTKFRRRQLENENGRLEHKVRKLANRLNDANTRYEASKAALSREKRESERQGKAYEAVLKNRSLPLNEETHTHPPQEDPKWEQRMEAAEARADLSEADLRLITKERDFLRSQVRDLEAKLQATREVTQFFDPSGGADIPDPTSMDELESWADEALSDSMIIAGKAWREARKSSFNNAALVAKTLHALDVDYRPSRVYGDRGAQERWEQFLGENHLDCSQIGHALENHRFKSAYQTTVRGKKFLMDRHLQGSNARDETRCFRLYFTFDEDSRKIVVGHFPTHLRNTYS